MNIDKLSITELKALAFDCITQRDQLNRNLEVIQRRIYELNELTKRDSDKPTEGEGGEE